MKMCEDFVRTNDERQTEKQGAYIYFDTNNSVWICSCKVTRKSFLFRHKEHMIKASTEHTTSCFYLGYPTENKPKANSRRRSSFFDNPVQFFAIGLYGVDNKEETKSITGEYD